jgi:RHS repeat-associated protein
MLRTALVLITALLLSSSAWAQGQVVEYYHLDALGTVRAVTDESGTVLERHDYLPFGEELCGTVVCGTSPGGGSKRFTGKERDAETGLDYFGARYYGSKMGRFTTIDPVYTWQENLVDPQRWNRYAYARNNPLKYTDPDGKAIDTIADIAFIAYDLIEMGVTRFTGGEVSGVQRAALGADLAAAAIPFATGAGIAVRAAARAEHAAEVVKTGVAVNRAVGKAGEAKVAAEIVEEGGRILGSQVCCKTSLGRRVQDHVIEDAAGVIKNVEVKTGGATRSAVQRAKDAEIAAGRGTYVGKNAPAELRGTQRAVETIERKPKG